MGPELISPQQFGFEDGRPTRYSDCYALGMVVYEVLSGHIPFHQHTDYVVALRVLHGERPGRPQGMERAWFTDDVWGVLERCWAPRRDNRPSIESVLQILDEASRSWKPLPPLEGPPAIDPPTWSLHDPGTEENTDAVESQLLPSRSVGQPGIRED